MKYGQNSIGRGRKVSRPPLWLSIGVCLALGVALLRLTAPSLLEKYSFSQVVRDREGRRLRVTLSTDEKYRMQVEAGQIPDQVTKMLLLYEDRFFFSHPGVNLVSLLRAAALNLAHKSTAGASTITMQVARLHYRLKTRTPLGKLRQIFAALWLETRYSKKEILDGYYHLAPYGGNVEGIAAASFFYFDRPLAKLSKEQIAALLLIPQNPNVRKITHLPRDNESWRTARSELVRRWNSLNPKDPMDPQSVHLPLVRDRRSWLTFEAPHFVGRVLNRVGHRAEHLTTLDLTLQKKVESTARRYLDANQSLGISNASVLLADLNDLSTLAYLGSADFWSDKISGQVDGVIARRSPGSTLKPLIYAMALDQGLIHPLTLLKDTPRSFAGFDPENFERNFRGPIMATEALVRSRNVPAVDLAMRLKDPAAYDLLRSQGVPLRSPEWYGISVVLGGAEVTLNELVEWYAALARREAPRHLRILKSEPLPSGKSWPISRESSYLVLQMLKKNQRDEMANFAKFRLHQDEIAWKTGTSGGFRDAWTIGIFGHYVLGVWLGNFDGSANPSLIGRTMAAPLFFDIAESVLRSDESERIRTGKLKEFDRWQDSSGLNLAKMEVCERSGGVPGPHCEHRAQVQVIPGKSPMGPCALHQRLPISKSTGLRVCPQTRIGLREFGDNTNADIVWKTFEVWPSDVQRALRDQGIYLAGPPPFPKTCQNTDELVPSASGLEIISPRQGVRYSVQWRQKEKSSIPLIAASDQGRVKLSWFVGSTFIGQSDPDTPLFWSARPGRFSISVTDDFGRTQSQDIEVDIR